MRSKTGQLKKAYQRVYTQDVIEKADIFENRMKRAPRPIFILSCGFAYLMGRLKYLDWIISKMPVGGLFHRFLLGNMALVTHSEISPPPPKSHLFELLPANNQKNDFDLIVIGSGPGGSVAALRSSEMGKKVLVIEMGESYESGSIAHHSLSQTEYQFGNAGLNFIYGSKPVIYAEGSTLGGGSEVNSGLYHRLEGAHRKRILSALEVSEAEWVELELIVESELSVQLNPNSLEPNYGLVLGARELNLIANEIPRWRKYKPVEKHQGMQETYLRKAFLNGVEFAVGRKVIDVIRGRDIEVVSRLNDGSTKRHTCKELVLACGTIQTPSLLNNSRISSCSFPLDFHPMIRMVAAQELPINNGDLFPSWQAWSNDFKYKYGYSVSTFPYLSATLKSLGEQRRFMDEDLSKMAAYFGSFSIEDSQVKLRRVRSQLVPTISWGRKDLDSLNVVSNMLRSALQNGKATEIWPKSGSSAVTTVHLFGSLPISKSRLIDKKGRLVQDSRIRISDGALMPYAPWGNPQGPIMVMCELMSRRNRE